MAGENTMRRAPRDRSGFRSTSTDVFARIARANAVADEARAAASAAAIAR